MCNFGHVNTLHLVWIIFFVSEDDLTVQQILERIGLIEYWDVFEKNEFDVEAFMNLEDKDLKELDIPHAPQKAIKEEIQRINIRATLGTIGLSKYCHVFEEQKFSFDNFLNVNDKDLTKLKIPLAPRKKIIEEIKRIKHSRKSGKRH